MPHLQAIICLKRGFKWVMLGGVREWNKYSWCRGVRSQIDMQRLLCMRVQHTQKKFKLHPLTPPIIFQNMQTSWYKSFASFKEHFHPCFCNLVAKTTRLVTIILTLVAKSWAAMAYPAAMSPSPMWWNMSVIQWHPSFAWHDHFLVELT